MTALYGIIGAFDTPEALTEAAAVLRRDGFRGFQIYTPFPLGAVTSVPRTMSKAVLPTLMFVAAFIGAAFGFWIQYWPEAVDYPINVGGRPYDSWPAFVVSAFEIMLLVALGVGFLGVLIASRLPRLYHPIFNSNRFQHASRDQFLICVEARDPLFEPGRVRLSLEGAGASSIEEVCA